MLIALPLGLGIGGLLGLLGAGGGILAVPALVYLLDQPVDAATTTALIVVTATATVGATANARHGTVDWRVAGAIVGTSVVGALAGSVLNRLASGDTILLALAGLMLAAAWLLARGRRLPSWLRPRATRNPAVIGSLGLLMGLLTGVFGVGGGFIIVPTLVLVLGLPIRVAIGTSLLIIAVTAAAGVGGHLAGGGVDWAVTGAFGLAGILGALTGARVGRRLAPERLARGFALVLVVVALALIAENAAGLWP